MRSTRKYNFSHVFTHLIQCNLIHVTCHFFVISCVNPIFFQCKNIFLCIFCKLQLENIFTCSACSTHHQKDYVFNFLGVLNELVPINTLYNVLHSVRGSLRERIRGREWQKGNTPGKCRDFVLSGSCSMNLSPPTNRMWALTGKHIPNLPHLPGLPLLHNTHLSQHNHSPATEPRAAPIRQSPCETTNTHFRRQIWCAATISVVTTSVKHNLSSWH